MSLAGIKLTSFGVFSKIKPLLMISKPKLSKAQKESFKSGDGVYDKAMFNEWIKVYQSPKMEGNDVTFPIIKMESSKLCGGNMNFPIKMEVYNYKENGNHKWKGEVIIPAKKLGKVGEMFNLFNS
jgi:hypothetical protein